MSTKVNESATSGWTKRIASGVLIVLAVLMFAVGALTTWLRIQLFDTDRWAEASRQTLQEPAVNEAVSTWAVDQVFDRTDPEELLGSALPPRLEPLAAPLASRLRVQAYGAASRAVADPRVEELWVRANVRAHTRFVNIVEGRDPIVLQTSRGLRLDLRPVLENVADKVGVNPDLVDKIPARVTQLEPRRSEEMERSLQILRFLDDFGGWVLFLSLPLLALGVWLAPVHRRAWMWTGVGLIVATFVVDALRTSLGPIVANAASETTMWRSAVLATWTTITAPLEDSTTAGRIIGATMVALAWLTGPVGFARTLRRVGAPLLVERRWIAIAGSAVIGLLLIRGIDVLHTRRFPVKVLLELGIIGAAWAMCHTAAAEAEESQSDDVPASVVGAV